MKTAKCDSKGRIYLKEAVRSRYGDVFVVLEEPSEIVLRPVPEDPVKDLEELGKGLRGDSIKEIKRRVRERAKKEALSALCVTLHAPSQARLHESWHGKSG